MNKNVISIEDLQIRIANYIEAAQLATHGISYDFVIEEPVDSSHEFSSIEGVNVYRIIQEAINNSVKYAEATLIKIHLKQKKDTLIFSISDNGKGFDVEIHPYTLSHNLAANSTKRALPFHACR
mgnify:CR=1 FL=1